MAAATPWARAFNRMDPLTVGIVVSLVAHAVMLAIRFSAADPNRFLPAESQLEVVLLNASTRAKPVNAEVLAQVNMEAGGDRDQGRARSPLPASEQARDGETMEQQQARIRQLEAEQQRLLALNNQNEPTPQAEPQQSQDANGGEQEELQRQIARMQAQIDRQLEDYARYVSAWADRIEKIGTERFPEEARGKMYDSLTVTVEVDKYGNVVDVLINKKSRYDVLNRKVKEIVLAGAPYDKFTPEMRKDGDILQIVRTWTFTNGSLQTKSAKR